MRIAAATMSVMKTTIGPTQFGKDVPQHDPNVPRPGGLRRFDELLLAEREEESAHDPGDGGPEQEARG